MPLPDAKIVDFIRHHHVLTLATSAGDGPWCSNMFYAYIPQENLFVFTSNDDTRHIREARADSRVAASIVLETRSVGLLRGLQIGGVLRQPAPGDTAARRAYLRRFPYAAVAELNLWILAPSYLKYTDNRLGFGKKILWRSDI